MNPNLKSLIELQKLDDVIRALEAEIRALPVKIAAIESTLSEHIREVEAGKTRIAENQKSRRKRESDIAALRDKITKLRTQTLEVKTNEQYKAMLHEIEFNERGIRTLEDEILAEMIESESLDRQLKEAEKSLAAEKARAQDEIRVAQERKRQDEEKLAVAQASREQARSTLSSDIYFGYQRIANAKRGIAVAEVLNEACAACHVKLRPQAYNEVQTNENILYCENCGRVLYFVPPPPPPPPAAAATDNV
jgi:uncharacterized protein